MMTIVRRMVSSVVIIVIAGSAAFSVEAPLSTEFRRVVNGVL